MKGLSRKKSRLLRTIIKKEDQIMDQNSGLDAKISKEETRTTKTMDLREMPPLPNRVSLQDQALHMGTTFRTTEDQMINAQISHSKKTMKIDLERDFSTTRMGTGETMEVFSVLHRLKGETSHKINPFANQEVISLTTLLSANLTIDLRLVLRPLNKSFRKTIIRLHLMWFASQQPTIPLRNCRMFTR